MTKRPVSREFSLESIKEEEETVSMDAEHFSTPRTSVSSLNDDDYVSVIDIDALSTESNGGEQQNTKNGRQQQSGAMPVLILTDCKLRGGCRLNAGFEHDEDDVYCGSSSRNGDQHPELEGQPDRRSKWGAIYLVSFMNFLIFLPEYTLTVVNFNYLEKIDPSVPVDYNGWMRAMMRLGHAIGSASFAVHCYTTKSYNPSLIVGRILCITSCLLYCFIEVLPDDQRRWPWLLVFLLQDIAEGSNIIFRSYVARLSTHADRQTAYAFLSGSEMIAIVAGPGIQALCGLIRRENEIYITDWLKLTKYTVPIWLCLLISFIGLAITLIFFKEPGEDEIVGKMEDEITLRKRFGTAWSQMRAMDSFVIVGCLIEKCIGSFGTTTILTLAAPFITATFNTSNYSAFLSIFQIIAGISSILTVVIFMLTKASKRIDPVINFAFALTVFLIMYGASYPWLDAYTVPVVLRDESNSLGCDPMKYSWCDGTRIVSPWAWVSLSGVLVGIAVPLAAIGFDTIYSRVLGNIDQNIMQAVLVVVVDCTMMAVPVVATTCFKLYGPNKWWLGVVGVMLAGIVLLVFLRPRLKRLIAANLLKPIADVDKH